MMKSVTNWMLLALLGATASSLAFAQGAHPHASAGDDGVHDAAHGEGQGDNPAAGSELPKV